MMMCQREQARGAPCFTCRTLGPTTEECRDVGLEPKLTGSNQNELNRAKSRPHNMYQQTPPWTLLVRFIFHVFYVRGSSKSSRLQSRKCINKLPVS
ncbi:hypothetical protein HanHA300_Chr15g0582331 [Helianthus annuus]|nr:hypothetical protein HanHA300_Chr15g0582331 [Helianthus annuus]KAJ0474644.1 hypothetical protein HanHA89_Chr15g0632081 [Helianthus annuus]KAJ0650201.1 hypothetical protein HanLR1_Chr15g0593001 [Helianthus annuus]KAJ0653972.1 hypothetical protein HanOQP8_Chr15g0589621 [Helianthus annuus]